MGGTARTTFPTGGEILRCGTGAYPTIEVVDGVNGPYTLYVPMYGSSSYYQITVQWGVITDIQVI